MTFVYNSPMLHSIDEPVYVFRLDEMTDTPFRETHRESMAAQGVVFVDQPDQADVAVTRYFNKVTTSRRLLLRIRSRRPLQFLIWTDEPRYNTFTANKIDGRGIVPDLHIMNCYTGDIYVNNYYHCFWGMRQRAVEIEEGPRLANRKIVILTTYTGNRAAVSLKLHAEEADISWLRCMIAAEGKRSGLVDIYGRGWPIGMSMEAPRMAGDWEQQKMTILRNYPFNLCFENTIYPYYCTEKIWHSVAAGCLPIYYGSGTNIYEDFPRDSFLDYSEFGSPEALFTKISTMSEDEYRNRMNLCVKTYNRIYDSGVRQTTRKIVVDNVIRRLRVLAGKAHS